MSILLGYVEILNYISGVGLLLHDFTSELLQLLVKLLSKEIIEMFLRKKQLYIF